MPPTAVWLLTKRLFSDNSAPGSVQVAGNAGRNTSFQGKDLCCNLQAPQPLALTRATTVAHSFPYMLLRASPAPTCWVSTINSVNALHTCCLNPPTGSGAGYWATPIWMRAVQYQRWGGPRNSRYSDLVLRPYDHQYLSPCEVLSVPAIRV